MTITDRGRPVARMTPMSQSSLEEMRAAGLTTPATRAMKDLPEPEPWTDEESRGLSDALQADREERVSW